MNLPPLRDGEVYEEVRCAAVPGVVLIRRAPAPPEPDHIVDESPLLCPLGRLWVRFHTDPNLYLHLSPGTYSTNVFQ